MRQGYRRDYDDVIEASSSAWNKLIAEQGRIASIETRSWAAGPARRGPDDTNRIVGHGNSIQPPTLRHGSGP
jgi:hypothetical protein